MQKRQLLGPVNYREIRETRQREIEFLVNWVISYTVGVPPVYTVRGNPTEKLFHIFVFLEQWVKYSECRLEVLLNDICKKKSSVINKKVQRVTLVVYAKYRTGKIWLGIAFTVCTYQSNHLKLPGTGINDGFEEMEHTFPFGMERFSYDLKKWFR